MIKFLNDIRNAEKPISNNRKIINTIAVLFLGIALGTFSKFLDFRQAELPSVLMAIDGALDVHNFLGRFAIWVLIALCISIYSNSAIRASINVFAFFIGMVASYYLYSNYVAGFFPRSYAMIWFGFTMISPFLAFVCWYAKGKSRPAFMLSVLILAVLFMMERFLERISLSEYRDKFILKGGMLVAAMVGLDARSTMDLDATVKGANVNVEDIENLISAIVSVPIDDGVKFQLKSISEIMDEAEYPGIRVSMTTTFDGVVTPLKIDISTGDAITPREVRYSFKLMLEDRSIDIWAYNLETVLAEKLETIITRTTTNTRMRDFYDIYILDQLHGNTLNRQTLYDALLATAKKRGTERHLAEAVDVLNEVESSPVMQKLWESYRKKFSYAADLEWNIIMGAVRSLYALSEKESSL